MRLSSIKWQALVLLSIMSILVVGCASEALPARLEATKSVLSLGEHINIECIISNVTVNSTGNFTYEWSNDGGSIEGEGEAIYRVASERPGTSSTKAEVS